MLQTAIISTTTVYFYRKTLQYAAEPDYQLKNCESLSAER